MALHPVTSKAGLLLAMVQGEIVGNPDEAKVSALDRGLFFGDGAYEVIQTYAGKMWGPDQHFRRLRRSLGELEIDNVDLRQVREWVEEAFEAVERTDCIIYFHITRGAAPRSHVVSTDLEPQFLLTIKPAHDNSDKATNGIAAISYPEIRWKRCDIKSLNLLGNVLAKREAVKRGAGEALFVENGAITEGAISNAFAVIGGKLVTHPLGHEILPGVTRQVVLAIARQHGVEIVERPFTLDEAYRAEELFVSGSGDEIRSLISLDGRPIGPGKPGPVARKIIRTFIDYTRSGGNLDALLNA